MFVDRQHADASEKGAAKPYSGPTGLTGWLNNFAKFAFTHHHSESLIPHIVFPLYIWIKALGPVNALIFGYGARDFVRAAGRGLCLSLCYIMHADWYNDCCDIQIDAKNKPSRPMPSGKCSLSQGLAIAGMYILFGATVLFSIYVYSPQNIFTCYTAAFVWSVVSAFFYSDSFLPTSLVIRRSAFGRIVTFCGIYFGFDFLCYTELCDGLSLDPLNFANPIVKPFFGYSATNFWFNIALLITKDMGDLAGDKDSGLVTVPVAIGSEIRSLAAVLVVFATYRLVHMYFHIQGYFTSVYYGIPLSHIACVVDVGFLAYYVYQFFTVVVGNAAKVNSEEEKKLMKPIVKSYMNEFPVLTIGTQFDVFLPSALSLVIK